MLAMLRAGELDAAIFGNELPEGDDLSTVFPDPETAGRGFIARHGFLTINHMVTIRAEVARRPGVARALMDRFRAGNPFQFGRAAVTPALTHALRHAAEQGLLQRPLAADEIWAGLPADCQE